MITIVIAIVLIIAGLFFWFYCRRIILTKACGIETDATVSRIESYTSSVGGSEEYPRRFYYALYKTQSGLENEARLLNPRASLGIGSRIRIRYLNDQADYAVLMEILDI